MTLFKKPKNKISKVSHDHALVSDELDALKNKCENIICLPFELTIVECDQIYTAISKLDGSKEIEVNVTKEGIKKTITLASPFDLSEFIFSTVYELPIATCILEHESTGSIVYWDDDEQYSLVAGTKDFCLTAFPHSYKVLEHYYVQSSLNDFEVESELRDCFIQLTKM